MAPFVRDGFLTVNRAIEQIAEQKCEPPLSDKEKAGLPEYRAWWYAVTHPKPQPITVIRKEGRRFRVTKPSTDPTPANQRPPMPNVTSLEELRGLKEREAQLNGLRAAATQELQQRIYSGQVPWVTITDSGEQFETPAHLSGGDQWFKLFRTGYIEWFDHGLRRTISGRPLVPADALEAVFNPDRAVREEPEPTVEAQVDEAQGELQETSSAMEPHREDPSKMPLWQRREKWEKRERELMSGEKPQAKTYEAAAKIIGREEGFDPDYVKRETRRVRQERRLKRGK